MKLNVAYLFLVWIVSLACANAGFEDEGNMDPYGGEDSYGGMGGMGGAGGMGGNPYGGGMDGYDGYGGYGGSGSRGQEPPPEIRELKTVDELKEFIKEEPVEATVVGFFDEATNSADLETFRELANQEGANFRFGTSTSKAVLEVFCFYIVISLMYFLNRMESAPF